MKKSHRLQVATGTWWITCANHENACEKKTCKIRSLSIVYRLEIVISRNMAMDCLASEDPQVIIAGVSSSHEVMVGIATRVWWLSSQTRRRVHKITLTISRNCWQPAVRTHQLNVSCGYQWMIQCPTNHIPYHQTFSLLQESNSLLAWFLCLKALP